MTFLEIQAKIDIAPALDFGDIINQSIELFKKVWLKGFIVVLIIMLLAFGVGFIFGLIGLAQGPNFFDGSFNSNELFNWFSINAIYSIPQTIIVSSFTIAMVGAFYRICREQESGTSAQDDYFYFFKREYSGKLLLLGILYTLIATVAQLLFFIPYIYAFVPLSYFSIIFANNPDLGETEIIKASFRLGNKKWLLTFGTMFITGILGMLGILACGIGVLFTISIVYLPVYLIYKQVVGFDNMDEIDSIGENQAF